MNLTADSIVTTTLLIPDMHCAACSGKVRRALEHSDGVIDLRFNPVRRQVLVDHLREITSTALIQHIEQAGFHPLLGDQDADASARSRDLLIRTGVAGFCMMQVMMATVALYAGVFEGITDAWRRVLEFSALLFTIPVITFSATPFFEAAYTQLRGVMRGGLAQSGFGMDATIALAIAAAFIVSLVNTLRGTGEVYYDAATMFATLMLATRYLDARLRDHLQQMDGPADQLPRRVMRIVDGKHQDVAMNFIQQGDVLFIREGEMLGVDGVLLKGTGLQGSAELDEAALTGESVWRTVHPGETLYAGTCNQGPAFEMRASGHMDVSRLARIDALTRTALTTKGHLATLADHIAALFVPAILVLAATAAAFWWFIDSSKAIPAALAVLVVSCPCALALAAPAALHATVARLKRAGILIRDVAALERLRHITHIAFDKTGTLTHPVPMIESVNVRPGFDQLDVMRLAGTLQQHVSHPLARAFPPVPEGRAEAVCVTQGQGVAGTIHGRHVRIGTASFCGVEAQAAETPGGRVVWMSVDGRTAATFRMQDVLREDAIDTVRQLRRLGFDTTMLSGDQESNCEPMATALGMAWQSRHSPESKAAWAGANSAATLFVGDGLNDMPALATASVSIVTLETTDLVKSKADAILLKPHLHTLVDLMVISRASRRIVVENLVWAGVYNAVAIPLAMAAIAPPWAAALGMSVSSLIVILNAFRVLKIRSVPDRSVPDTPRSVRSVPDIPRSVGQVLEV